MPLRVAFDGVAAPHTDADAYDDIRMTTFTILGAADQRGTARLPDPRAGDPVVIAA